MPNQSTTVSQQDVARLVAEVVRRIRQQAASTTPAGPALSPANPSAASATGGRVRLADRVIGTEAIERLPAGTTQVTLPHRAVVTPSARDAARERGITLTPEAKTSVAANGRPLMIARAECRTDVSVLAASISRAVPTSQQLPAAGLTSVLASLADHAGRDAARGLLLTDNPAVACVAANRHRALRAVTATDPASLEAAATACAANLIIVAPGQFPARSLERMAAALTTREATPPASLTLEPAATGCSCHQGAHAH